MPTSGPDVAAAAESRDVLDVLIGRSFTTSNWTNGETCGWISGSSSESFACGHSGTCATNPDNIVGCVSGTVSPFYSSCLNYDAYQKSSCTDEGLSIGCCMNTEYPECATYLWTGSPVRSMYRCWSSQAVISMLDVPQAEIDASLSSVSASATVTATQHSVNSGPRITSGTDSDDSSSQSHNLSPGAWAGILIGTVAGLVLCYLIFKCMRKLHKDGERDFQEVQEHLDSYLLPNWQQSPATPTPAGRQANPAATPEVTAARTRNRATVNRLYGPDALPETPVRGRRSTRTGPSRRRRVHHSRHQVGTPSPADRVNPPSYEWSLMSPRAPQSISYPYPYPQARPQTPFGPAQSTTLSSVSTPPPRYSVMNPYPEATPNEPEFPASAESPAEAATPATPGSPRSNSSMLVNAVSAPNMSSDIAPDDTIPNEMDLSTQPMLAHQAHAATSPESRDRK
ncbi:hypothetical protein M426DRAFT_253977 [Hypoxylon sp. CI-4A]|nr:hypothetical protein M426DRAFT_253977 [Hypoxylon sp. CI-4A]